MSTRLPVTVLSGFLGAGKTTLLNHLLSNREDPAWGDRRQELAIIGIGLDEAGLRADLDACLLTEREMREGPAQWQPSPFPQPTSSTRSPE